MLIYCLITVHGVYAGTVIDQVGRKVVVPDDPQRVISLAPSITEIIYDLGEEKRLQGVTKYSDYPAQAKSLPKVGTYVHLDLERIVALKPDLCISTKDGNPKHVIEKISRLGIPVYAINPRSLEQTMDTITQIGSLLNAQEAAARLVSGMQQRITRVQSLVAQVNNRPRVFFQIDAEPLVSAGNNTFIHELIELAGGINTAAGNDPYPRYSWEDILILQPDIVIISSMAGGLDSEDLLGIWKKWSQLKAVLNEQVFVVDAGMFDRTTPRLVAGLETIAEIIHPELFKQYK
ncbi:MAG: cobalamin-binding protein [Deltaproteobacteria bacterium]|nr:MAG: cobalamin-binding protein [Deltaproteobacteria bacterium]